MEEVPNDDKVWCKKDDACVLNAPPHIENCPSCGGKVRPRIARLRWYKIEYDELEPGVTRGYCDECTPGISNRKGRVDKLRRKIFVTKNGTCCWEMADDHAAKKSKIAKSNQKEANAESQSIITFDSSAIVDNMLLNEEEGGDDTDDDKKKEEAMFSTTNLLFYKCVQEDAQDYFDYLYNDKDVMEKFADGKVKDLAYVKGRVKDWAMRWENGNQFSAFTVRTDEEVFLGTMVLGGAAEPNSSEIAGLLRKDKWGSLFASQAICMLGLHAFKLHESRAKLPNGKEFKSIVATCRDDNIASVKLLEESGYLKGDPIEIHSKNPRHLYKYTFPS